MSAARDRVILTGLKARAVLGIHPWERKRPRPVVIDLEVPCDAAPAAKADDLALAVDYHRLSRDVVAHVARTKHRLVEALAEDVAALVRREFRVPWVRVRVHKPGAVPAADDVAVEVVRGKA